jgi:hypothetical protein
VVILTQWFIVIDTIQEEENVLSIQPTRQPETRIINIKGEEKEKKDEGHIQPDIPSADKKQKQSKFAYISAHVRSRS